MYKPQLEGPAAIYLRVSDGSKQELRRQRTQFAEWLKKNTGVRVRRKYEEHGSGRGGYVRKELNAMLADARANQFEIAIFWEVSRLGRNTYEALKVVKEFRQEGISVYIADIGMFFDTDDGMVEAMLGMMLTFSQFEHQINKKRTREGMHGKKVLIAELIAKKKLPEGTRVGKPGIIEKWITDPNKRKHKKGLLVAPDPERAAHFAAVWLDTEITGAYAILQENLRIPISPECDNKCRVEGGKLLKSAGAKCYCGKKPSRKAIHKVREALGLPPRSPHSFKRKSVKVSTHDEILESLGIVA